MVDNLRQRAEKIIKAKYDNFSKTEQFSLRCKHQRITGRIKEHLESKVLGAAQSGQTSAVVCLVEPEATFGHPLYHYVKDIWLDLEKHIRSQGLLCTRNFYQSGAGVHTWFLTAHWGGYGEEESSEEENDEAQISYEK